MSTQTLPQDVEDNPAGSGLAASVTAGPRLRADAPPYGNMLAVPVFASPTPEATWWGVWAKQTRQDFRAFAPVHRKSCNVLFADGHVGSIIDVNGDGHVNNGFLQAGGGFSDTVEEISANDLESLYSLTNKPAHQVQ
jgi:prepilin-type processing-associated H-X9-DG protein